MLKCGNEDEATVACMGQGSCAAVMKLCTSYWDFSAVLKVDFRAERGFLRFFLGSLAHTVRESTEVVVYVFFKNYFSFTCLWDKNRHEKVSQRTSTPIISVQQYLSNSFALKVDVATFVFYAILLCLCSTASPFKGHVKIVCGRKASYKSESELKIVL